VKKDNNSMISIEDKDSLIGVKWHLKIEHEDEDNNLLVCLQKQYDSVNRV
jgi:hypothetical protein